jgi:4-hydroxy-tetrahydrodipicolinate synthase
MSLMRQKIRNTRGGFYSYLATPFKENGDVNYPVLERYTKAIVESGVDGVTCLASTCEGPYLSDEESLKVLKTVSKAVAGRCMLNVGIGAMSTAQVLTKAKQAKDNGATSLMLELQQYYPVTLEDAYEHYATIAENVSTSIRLYNLPLPTKFDFTPQQIFELSKLKTISSVKEASGDVSRIKIIRALCGKRYEIFCGFHYQVLDGFRFGADGWEVMLHPHIAKPCIKLYKLLKNDPWSKQGETLFKELETLFLFFKTYGVPQSVKAISNWTDLKLGRPRAPFRSLNQQETQRLKEIVNTVLQQEA